MQNTYRFFVLFTEEIRFLTKAFCQLMYSWVRIKRSLPFSFFLFFFFFNPLDALTRTHKYITMEIFYKKAESNWFIFGTEKVYIIFTSRKTKKFTFDLKANYFVLVVISNRRNNQEHIMRRITKIVVKTIIKIRLLCMYNKICNLCIYICAYISTQIKGVS